MRGVNRPQYRLRIGEIRVFYDVVGTTVEVLAIIPKSKAAEWLEKMGGRNEKGCTIRGEGSSFGIPGYS